MISTQFLWRHSFVISMTSHHQMLTDSRTPLPPPSDPPSSCVSPSPLSSACFPFYFSFLPFPLLFFCSSTFLFPSFPPLFSSFSFMRLDSYFLWFILLLIFKFKSSFSNSPDVSYLFSGKGKKRERKGKKEKEGKKKGSSSTFKKLLMSSDFLSLVLLFLVVSSVSFPVILTFN